MGAAQPPDRRPRQPGLDPVVQPQPGRQREVAGAELALPQRQRQRKQTELMQDLGIGDEVQTAAGMFGKIVQLSDEFAWVELAPGTTIKMLRRAVIGKVGPIEEAEPGPAE